MALVQMNLACRELSALQRALLQSGLTQLTEQILRQPAPYTVVVIDQAPALRCSSAGVPLEAAAWAAHLHAYVTAGTTTSAERGRFIAAAHALVLAQWASPPQAPIYAIVQEVPADSWGYDGRTQEARRGAPDEAPRTLRSMTGQTGALAPGPSGTALVLIDFQREYLDGKLPLTGLADAARHAAQLLAAADAAGIAVIHVHHESASPAAAFFAAGGPGVQAVDELPVAPHHHRVVKRMPSSFHATSLADLLERVQARTLVLAGCMTHNCVDSTAREALHRNDAVVVAADACAARDLPAIDGGFLSAQQVHSASLSALADRHVDVLDTHRLADAWRASARQA